MLRGSRLDTLRAQSGSVLLADEPTKQQPLLLAGYFIYSKQRIGVSVCLWPRLSWWRQAGLLTCQILGNQTAIEFTMNRSVVKGVASEASAWKRQARSIQNRPVMDMTVGLCTFAELALTVSVTPDAIRAPTYCAQVHKGFQITTSVKPRGLEHVQHGRAAR